MNASFVESLISRIVAEEIKLLDEKAVPLDQLEAEAVALMILGDSTDKVYILYDTTALKNFLGTSDFSLYPNDPDTFFVVSFVASSWFEMCNFWTIDMSAARNGYGPISYEIVMSEVSPDFITSDRKNVSSKARNVWQRFYTDRANEFDIKPISYKTADENETCGHAKAGSDISLTKAFSIKSKLNVGVLIENHKRFLDQTPKGFDHQFLTDYIYKSGQKFFRENYKG